MKTTTRRSGDAAVFAAIVGSILLAGCAARDAGPAATEVATPPPPETPTREHLLAATVSGPWAEPVTLAAGRYDGPPAAPGAASHPTLELLQPTVLFGDIDGTPPNEAVALLAASEGGTGEFIHLGVFAMRDGRAESIATAPIGDRVQLFRAWLERQVIHMDVIEAGPGEPACCPTQLTRKAFSLQDGKLVQVENEAVSSLSVNLLAATDWMLVEMDGQPLPEGLLPPTALIQYGKVTGFAGCNRYNGPLTESKPGVIKLGALTATEKACDGAATALETQFLERLGHTGAYTFAAGRLVLSAPKAAPGGPGTLVFAR